MRRSRSCLRCAGSASVHRPALGARRPARGWSRGALSARLSPLEEDGLIRRTTDPDDRRKVHVTLTRAGKRAFDRHGQHEGRDEAALLDTLSVADQRRLSDLLRTLVLAVEEAPV